MDPRITTVHLRPTSGGMRPHSGTARTLVLCATLALSVLGCSEDEPDEKNGASANGANAGNTSPSGGNPASGAAQAPGQMGAADPGAGQPNAPDASRVWPSCGETFEDEDGGVSPYEDGCAIDERFGVFASPGVAADAFADGTRSYPFATLKDAVAAAVNGGKHVFACEGTFEEPLRIGTELSNGLRVYGGLSCETFAIESPSARTHVHATGAGPALVIAETQDVLVERFVLENAPSADPEPGTSYVGAFVQRAQRVVLRDVVLHAHGGERGEDGAPPDGPAGDGTRGNDGGNACSARPNPGGAVVSSAGCREQTNAFSGSGGDGGEGTGNGGSGTWFGFPQIPGESAAGWSCTVGMGLPSPPQGIPGPGPAGRGGRGFGALLGTGFVGFGGQDGVDGQPGIGGGGGGGAKAPSSCPSGTAVGASGGGGGSGGCGGKGGEAGGSGGASLGLLVVGSTVRVERGDIRYGDGGAGGNGALGQKGGKGAPGGAGGKGASGSKDACNGAAGGDGGDGGAGGGGNGGHAFGVLFSGRAPKLIDVAGEQTAADHHGGAPGTGPDPALMDGVGSPGQTAFLLEF